MLVDPDVLSHSDSCGSSGCHEQILAEWQPSAHRFSAMNPALPGGAARVRRRPRRGPDALLRRLPRSDLALRRRQGHCGERPRGTGSTEGTSCVVCHSISQVDQRGNGDYVLTPPRKYIGEAKTGAAKWVSDFLIRAYPRQHLADYDRNLLRTPEFCGSCHKQFIPEALNRFGLSPGQNQYDEWRESHWHSDDPQEDLSCRDCHMRLVPGSRDPGRGEDGDVRRAADDGAHRHHGTIATNMFMPAVLKLPNWKTHVKLTEEWIRGETIIPEIADRWPEGPVATVKILGPERAAPGEEIAVRVVVTNRKAGHNFTTGPLDFVRAWVHLRLRDAGGATLAEWGAIDPETRAITDAVGISHVVGNPRDQWNHGPRGRAARRGRRAAGQARALEEGGGTGRARHLPALLGQPGLPVRGSSRGPRSHSRWSPTSTSVATGRSSSTLTVPDMESESGVYQATVTQDSYEKRIDLVDRLTMLEPPARGDETRRAMSRGARRRGSRRTQGVWLSLLWTGLGVVLLTAVAVWFDTSRETDLGDPTAGVTAAFKSDAGRRAALHPLSRRRGLSRRVHATRPG